MVIGWIISLIKKKTTLINIYNYAEKYKIYDIDWEKYIFKKTKNTPIAVIKNEPKINRTFEKKYYDILHVEDVFQEDEKPIKQEILIGEENFYKEVTLTEETMNEAMTNLDDDSDVDFFW